VGLFGRHSPEWAYVYNTPASQPPPQPQWVTGTVSSYDPNYLPAHVSGGDLPTGHNAYDYTVDILPDPASQYLLAGSPGSATGNYAGGGEEKARLHVEWEDLTVPKFAWAEKGDRVTLNGSWVWDCGHWGVSTQVYNPDYVLPHYSPVPIPCLGVIDPKECTVTGEKSEFHPYRVLWDIRAQPDSGAHGESEALLFASTQKTKAGIESDCAHAHPPPVPGVAYADDYFSCLLTSPDWQDVSGDYSFLLPAPPSPGPGAHMTMRAVDHGSVAAPVPTLTQEGSAVRASFHLASSPGQVVKSAYTIYAGWDVVPAAVVPTHLHVSIDAVQVHRAMDPGCSLSVPSPGCQDQSTRILPGQAGTAPGEWDLYWDVQGNWGQFADGEFNPNDGDILKGKQSVELYVPPGKGWAFTMMGRECDLGGLGFVLGTGTVAADCPSNTTEIADDNDVPGLVRDVYGSALASVGTHTSNGRTHNTDPTSTCPDSNLKGCYSVTYTVSLVDDAASRVINPPPVVLPNTAVPVPILGAAGAAILLAAGLTLGRWRRRPIP
jgi:hypothetical protein